LGSRTNCASSFSTISSLLSSSAVFILMQIVGDDVVLGWLAWPADSSQYFQVWRWFPLNFACIQPLSSAEISMITNSLPLPRRFSTAPPRSTAGCAASAIPKVAFISSAA
jgi:hypothetical protein